MRIVDLKQGSQEWLDFRLDRIGGSDAPAIMGTSKYKSKRMLWNEKLGISKTRMNEHMERGVRLEPRARDYCNITGGWGFEPLVAVSDIHDWQMASFDGYCKFNGYILEIKCPSEIVFRDIQSNGWTSDEHMTQIIHQLCVAGDKANGVVLLYYFENADGIPEIINFDFPKKSLQNSFQSMLSEELHFFEEYMKGFNEPPLSKLDVVLRNDDEWRDRSRIWLHAKTRLDEVEEFEREARDRLIDCAGTEGFHFEGCGVSVSRGIRRGNVDYSQIPELKGINTEKYRKPPTSFWRLGEKKQGG